MLEVPSLCDLCTIVCLQFLLDEHHMKDTTNARNETIQADNDRQPAEPAAKSLECQVEENVNALTELQLLGESEGEAFTVALGASDVCLTENLRDDLKEDKNSNDCDIQKRFSEGLPLESNNVLETNYEHDPSATEDQGNSNGFRATVSKMVQKSDTRQTCRQQHYYLTRLLESDCFTAVSDLILQRILKYCPERLTNRLLMALIPPHARELTLERCDGVMLMTVVGVLEK